MKSIARIAQLVAAVSWLLTSTTSTASEQVRAQRMPPLGLGWSIEGGVLHQFEADLDEGGRVDATRANAAVGLRYAFDEGTSVGLAAGYGYDRYGFSGNSGLGGGTPWNEIHSVRAALPMFWQPAPRWQVIAIPALRMSAESPGDWDDGLTGGAILGFSYRFTDRLKLGPGVGVTTELEEDVNLFPILVVDWRPTDRLRIQTGGGLGATRGPGLQASYEFAERWRASVAFRRERLRFRLDGGGVGEDRSFPILAGMTWGPPFATLSLFGGVKVGGELRLEDEGGNNLMASDYDPTAIVGLSFRLLL